MSASDPSILVLTSLARGPKHGYALMLDVEEIAGVRLGAGTIYGVLNRLEARGWIESMEADDRRRPYKLTDAGRNQVRAELRRLDGLVRAGLPHLEQET